MKTLSLALLAVAALTSSVEAGRGRAAANCCPTPVAAPAQGCCYTILPYHIALQRAADADKAEAQVKELHAQLAQLKQELVAATDDKAAALKRADEAEAKAVASQQQAEEQSKLAVAEKANADKSAKQAAAAQKAAKQAKDEAAASKATAETAVADAKAAQEAAVKSDAAAAKLQAENNVLKQSLADLQKKLDDLAKAKEEQPAKKEEVPTVEDKKDDAKEPESL